MKKLLGISLVAVLAATPLMAGATDLSETQLNYATPVVADASNMATVSYVKGAYTELGNVINTKADKTALADEKTRAEGVESNLQSAIDTLNGNSSVTGSVDKKIADAISTVNTAAANLEGRVGANEDAIELLNGDASTSGSVAYEVAQEATARATAVSAEATARQDADTALGTRIDNEKTARETADNTINNKIGTTALTTEDKTLTGAIEEVNQAVSNLSTTANSTYQLKSESRVDETGTYNYISGGTGVAANLVALDTRAKTNADDISTNAGAIATINNKQIPVVITWGSSEVTQKKISDLVTAQN